MSGLQISGLVVEVAGRRIIHGIDLHVGPGEVHAVMGPNGAGKSTLSAALMGRSGYDVIEGSVTLDGTDLLGLPTWQRAQAGLHLVMQYPTEVPGVKPVDMLAHAFAARRRDVTGLVAAMAAEADRIGLAPALLERALNVDLSGGEKKRNETLQLAMLKPRYVILDELDSGLDIDALRDCARRVEVATNETGLGVVAITHYNRLLAELHPDFVHILVKGRLVASGGPELADQLEIDGYAAFDAGLAVDEPPTTAGLDDLFAMP